MSERSEMQRISPGIRKTRKKTRRTCFYSKMFGFHDDEVSASLFKYHSSFHLELFENSLISLDEIILNLNTKRMMNFNKYPKNECTNVSLYIIFNLARYIERHGNSKV